ncbi:MAG: DivIVA domain-containing protein [Bacilli bacterium]|nr:DivIVA domain-containing protein [Bacilli bacterium]
MDDNQITLTADKILHKSFTPNVKGYDPDEVDDYLDRILRDYVAFDKWANESNKYIAELETQLRKARERAQELEVENAKMKSRLSGIKSTDRVTPENIDYVTRISRLETALYKLGVDPKKI